MIVGRVPRAIVVALIALCATIGVGAHAAGAGTVVHLPIVASASPPTATPDPIAEIEGRIGALINQARASEGLPPLTVCSELMRAARRHSADMAAHDFCDHDGSDGSTPGQRITDAGYVWHACGENVAAGYPSPEAVVDAWLRSDGHRAAILSDVYADMGVGYAYGPGGYQRYYTVDLGTR